MVNNVYKISEVYGSSPDSIQAAIDNAIGTAAQSLSHLDWFEVTEIRGQIADGKCAHYQVGVKLGFRYEKG